MDFNTYIYIYIIKTNWFKTSEVVHRFITTALFRMVKNMTTLIRLYTGRFNKYHLLFSNYNSMFGKV